MLLMNFQAASCIKLYASHCNNLKYTQQCKIQKLQIFVHIDCYDQKTHAQKDINTLNSFRSVSNRKAKRRNTTTSEILRLL